MVFFIGIFLHFYWSFILPILSQRKSLLFQFDSSALMQSMRSLPLTGMRTYFTSGDEAGTTSVYAPVRYGVVTTVFSGWSSTSALSQFP